MQPHSAPASPHLHNGWQREVGSAEPHSQHDRFRPPPRGLCRAITRIAPLVRCFSVVHANTFHDAARHFTKSESKSKTRAQNCIRIDIGLSRAIDYNRIEIHTYTIGCLLCIAWAVDRLPPSISISQHVFYEPNVPFRLNATSTSLRMNFHPWVPSSRLSPVRGEYSPGNFGPKALSFPFRVCQEYPFLSISSETSLTIASTKSTLRMQQLQKA